MHRKLPQFARLVVAVTLMAVATSNVALAGKSSGGGSNNRSSKSSQSFKNSQSGNHRQTIASKQLGKVQAHNVQQLNQATQQATHKKFSSQVSKLNQGSHQFGKAKPSVIKSTNQNINNGTANSGNFGGKVRKLAGETSTDKPGHVFNSLNGKFGGAVASPLQGGVLNPYHAKSGNAKQHGGNHQNDHAGGGKGNKGKHHHRYPWPIFWPIYGGNYWHNPCYYQPICPTPTVIYNNVPPRVIHETITTAVPTQQAAASSTADLVLEDVLLVEPATAIVGPAYRVRFRNQGLVVAGRFRVALIAAVDGQADEQSPQSVVEVTGLAAGHANEVIVRLPETAMKMVDITGQATAFTHLLVAVDLDNAVSESDKTNNVAIIPRTQLEVATR